MLFLAFESPSVERSERSSQFLNKHRRLSSLAELLGHFISLTFDFFKVILEVASRQDYGECNFFFVLPTLSHFLTVAVPLYCPFFVKICKS